MVKLHHFRSVGFSSECYIVWDEDSGDSLIIDPACDYRLLLEFAIENSLVVKGILLTHGHFDHTLSLEELRWEIDVPVYIHAEDNELLSDSEKCAFSLFYDGIYTCFPADVLISDGDILRLGNLSVKVMHAPGHTKGSVCYFIEDMLFSGDVLFKEAVGRTDLYSSSAAEMHSTLEKLKEMKQNYTVYPGHGDKTTLFHEIKYNPYMK